MAAATKLQSIARGFASSSSAAQLVKPPIQVFGLEGRYATALYSAATKQKQLEAVEKDLISFQKTLKTDTKLHEFVVNPTIKHKLKSEALKAVAGKMSLSAPATNLLQLMAENGRLKKVDNVINVFKMLMAAHRGEVVCEVTTAKPLDAGMRKQLEDVLQKFVKSNEKILLTAKVEPALLGGMVVSIGDRYVDMSVSSKVKKYTDVISAAV